MRWDARSGRSQGERSFNKGKIYRLRSTFFYDEAFAPFTDPLLCSVNLNWRRVGEIAAPCLISLWERRDDERLRVVVPAHTPMHSKTLLSERALRALLNASNYQLVLRGSARAVV